jgi:hypothetical protein
MTTADAICRILCASLCTYGIDKDGGVKGSPFAQNVGFTDAPVATFTAGIKGIDACYVADTDDSVILAFRGTSFAKPITAQVIFDWIDNFLAEPVEVEGIPGKLHQGFSDSIQRLWKKGFPEEVKKRMGDSKPLIITGYSKSGGLTPIAAAMLNKILKIDASRINIRIFESPRTGDGEFKNFFNSTFDLALRYEYHDDIVPHVPPLQKELSAIIAVLKNRGFDAEKIYPNINEWDYHSVGKLKFVNWKNKIVDDSPLLYAERDLKIIKMIESSDKKLLSDHLPKEHLYPILCPNNPYPKGVELTFG